MPKFRSLQDLTKQVKRALEMPSVETSVLNLLGNQRISLLSLFVSPKVWKENGAEVNDSLFYTQPVSIGLDLSARNDLTSCLACAKDPETGDIHVKPFTYTPLNTLEEREASDRAPYKTWVDQGHMTALPGVSLDYDMLAEAIKADTDGMNVTHVSFDRWRIEIFQASADRCGLFQDAQWLEVGQGFRDFSPRLEALETLLLQRRVHHGNAPLLTMSASNAIVVTDPTGAKKIDKSKSTTRIDPLVALTMGVFPLTDGQTEGVDVESMII
jgi:phage terminase large subunit-like protein